MSAADPRGSTPAFHRRVVPRLRSGSGGYMWIAPAFVLLGAFLFYPILGVVQYAFTSRTTFLPGEFVGLENFGLLFSDPAFWRAFKNNLILLISVPATIFLALCITGVLYRGLRGSRVYEALIFLPFLPAVASIGVIYLYLLSNDGPVNSALDGVGLAQPWLSSPDLAIWSVLAVVIWKRLGFTVLLFTTRMTNLDRSFFDAASVDGASWFRTFWQVAVPQMRSIIAFAGVLGFIEVFSWTFAYVFILTRGGPAQSTFTLEFLLYQLQFEENLVGLGSAVAVLLLAVALCVAVYRIALVRREEAL